MAASEEDSEEANVTLSQDDWMLSEDGQVLTRLHRVPRRELFTPCRERCPLPIEPLSPSRHTYIDDKLELLTDVWTHRDTAHRKVGTQMWTGLRSCLRRCQQLCHLRAEVAVSGETKEVALAEWGPKQWRQVKSAAKAAQASMQGPKPEPSTYQVIEVFSPPRFALEGCKTGLSCLSADLITGWDFRKASDRDLMRKLIREQPPELLILSPPCTRAGGWFHLNRIYMSPEGRHEKELLTKRFINFSAELATMQLEAGKRVLFEHPRGSLAWSLPRMRQLATCLHTVDLDMCCFDPRIPHGKLIKKSTRLLVSHQNMRTLGRRCPGDRHAEHREHQVVAGSTPEVQLVSKYAGQYPVGFVIRLC